jgi:hypothetical protein
MTISQQTLAQIFASLAVMPALSSAALTDNFDTGTYPSSGTGWATGWIESENQGEGVANARVDGTVTSTSPLNGGGSYLSVTTLVSNSETGIRRNIGSMSASPYTLTFDWRYDSDIANFNSYGDRIHFGASTGSGFGSSASFTWIIGVVGGNNGGTPYNAKQWYFYNGSSTSDTDQNTFSLDDMHMTGMMLQSGVVYSITVNVDPASQTYSATINNGTTSYSASDLNFRNQGSTNNAANLIFGGANTGSGHNLNWSIDSINVVPEPSSGLLAMLAGFLCFFRRRIAH